MGFSTRYVSTVAAAVAAAVFGLSAPARAAVVRTTAEGNGADAPLGNDSGFSSTSAGGATSTAMELRSNDSGTNRNRLGIVRFDLAGITGDLSGASVSFTETGNNSRTVTVYGLVDGDAGETWDESTTNYDTAPGISLITGSSGGPATDFDAARILNLGTFGTTGSTNETLTFSGAALDTFLANDTNDLVTFYLSNPGGGSVTVRTKENDTPPTLALPNADVPEPAALSVLGLGGLALFRRRRRLA